MTEKTASVCTPSYHSWGISCAGCHKLVISEITNIWQKKKKKWFIRSSLRYRTRWCRHRRIKNRWWQDQAGVEKRWTADQWWTNWGGEWWTVKGTDRKWQNWAGANKASGSESAAYELAINSTHYNVIVLFIEEQLCNAASGQGSTENTSVRLLRLTGREYIMWYRKY